MAMMKRIKDVFSRYLERLGRENQELFGGGRPDCCSPKRRQGPPAPRHRRPTSPRS